MCETCRVLSLQNSFHFTTSMGLSLTEFYVYQVLPLQWFSHLYSFQFTKRGWGRQSSSGSLRKLVSSKKSKAKSFTTNTSLKYVNVRSFKSTDSFRFTTSMGLSLTEFYLDRVSHLQWFSIYIVFSLPKEGGIAKTHQARSASYLPIRNRKPKVSRLKLA